MVRDQMTANPTANPTPDSYEGAYDPWLIVRPIEHHDPGTTHLSVELFADCIEHGSTTTRE